MDSAWEKAMASRFRIIHRIPTDDEIIAMIEAVMAQQRAVAEQRMTGPHSAAAPRRRVPMNWW
jgi:hypothetical protein